MLCEKCKKRQTRHSNGKICEACKTKDWRKRNPKKVKSYAKMRRVRDAEKIKVYSKIANNDYYFGGNRIKVLERDNYTCQTCGKNKEDGKTIIVHHKDITGWGKKKKDKNNSMNNLISLCVQCHMAIHRPSDKINKISKYPELLQQDDSEYRYPKIREILFTKKNRLGTLEKAKEELAKEIGLSFDTIDSYHYERKATTFVQKTKCRFSINGKCTGNWSPLKCDGLDVPDECKEMLSLSNLNNTTEKDGR